MRLRLTLLIVLLTGLSFQACADSIDQQLYKALKVKEVNKTPDGLLGSTEMEKKAGSLVCKMTRVVAPTAKSSYKCTLVGGSDNDLYNALTVPEKDVTPAGLMGSRHIEKKVGTEFLCTRTQAVVPNPIPKTTCGFVYKNGTPGAPDEGAGAKVTN